MSVKETKPMFRCSDGKEFDSKKEAEFHDKLVLARESYDEARRALNHAIARTQKTADGVLFDSGIFRSYYYITPGYGGLPQIIEAPYFGWNYNLDEYEDRVEISLRDGENRRYFAIQSLYSDKRKAEESLVIAQEAWLAERAAEIAENRAETFPA